MIEGGDGQFDLPGPGQAAIGGDHIGHNRQRGVQQFILFFLAKVLSLLHQPGERLLFQRIFADPRQGVPSLQVQPVLFGKPFDRFGANLSPLLLRGAIQLRIAGIGEHHALHITEKELPEHVGLFIRAELCGGHAGDTQNPVDRAVLPVVLQLEQQGGDHVDRGPHLRKPFQRRGHFPIILCGVQPGPGEEIFPVRLVVGLVLVPENCKAERPNCHKSA